jgi:hypothetical protein
MSYHDVADVVVIVHFGFLAFVVIGGLFAIRWPWIAWVHLPAAIWGILIEFFGWICPLTPLEIELRHRAGEPAYTGGFIARYVTHVLYPNGLTRGMQVVLGALVLALNGILYAVILARWRCRVAAAPQLRVPSGR